MLDPVRLGIAPALQANLAPVHPKTALLVATKGHVRSQLEVRVNPDAASLELLRYALGAGHVLAPDGGAQAQVRRVDAADDVVLVAPPEDGHDGAEGLVDHDARVVGRVVDDGGGHVEALAVLGARGAPQRRLPPLLRDLLVELLQLPVLHAVLDRAEERLRVRVVARLERFGHGDHRRQKLVVDVLVHVDPLDVHADLSAVDEGEEGNLFWLRQLLAFIFCGGIWVHINWGGQIAYLSDDRVNIDIVRDDSCVVTAKF